MSDLDNISKQQAQNGVEAAYLAFAQLAAFDQEKVDNICSAMANAALEQAERLGRMAHDETGFGKPEDKKEKNRFAAEDVWKYFRSLKTVGVVSDEKNLVEIVSPRGVVAAIIPSTNPTSTTIFKILISIKSRNTVVLSPHPSASGCIAETARIMRETGIRHGLPQDAIICLENSTIEGTEVLMKHPRTAVILATGGIGLVRAAYSSGKPAFGVGPGNVPVFIERSADIQKAVSDILTSTCFDNGTICASEQSVVVDAPIEMEVREQFKKQGAYFLDPTQSAAVADVLLTPKRTLNAGIVGRSAKYIAELAGIKIPEGVRCLIADCNGVGREFPWSVEKLSPTLAFFVANGVENGADRCDEILHFGGMGHTAGMHTRNREAAIRFGERMPASRIIINSPTTHGAIGLSTDLSPSMTLGCGSWGGNVTSDNISPLHLMDIKRVAFETKTVSKITTQPASKVVLTPGSAASRPTRSEIAKMVDGFIRSKLQQMPASKPSDTVTDEVGSNSPVKTIIHELRPQSLTDNGFNASPVPFVSEADVRDAVSAGNKIYINSKTIITPSARDLGEEKEVFARV